MSDAGDPSKAWSLGEARAAFLQSFARAGFGFRAVVDPNEYVKPLVFDLKDDRWRKLESKGRRGAGRGRAVDRGLALTFAESAHRRARGVADAVEPLRVREPAALHLEAHQLRDHVAVRVVVAGARRALVADRLAR